MDNLKTRTIIMTLSGIIIGFMIVVILYMCGAYPMEMLADRPAFLAQIVGSMLLGGVNMGATVIYDIDKWGLVRATLTHYIISVCSFIIAEKLLKWFDDSILLIVLAVFTFVYLLIWLANFFSWKRRIKRINRDLENMLRREKEDDHQ